MRKFYVAGYLLNYDRWSYSLTKCYVSNPRTIQKSWLVSLSIPYTIASMECIVL